MQVRHLAARALVPLVPQQVLAATVAAALGDVPAAAPVACHNQVPRMCMWAPSMDKHLNAGMIYCIYWFAGLFWLDVCPVMGRSSSDSEDSGHYCVSLGLGACLAPFVSSTPAHARIRSAHASAPASSVNGCSAPSMNALCHGRRDLRSVLTKCVWFPMATINSIKALLCMQAHGVLLQARLLLESAAGPPASPAAADVMAAAAPLLAQRAWLLGPANACAPLGADYAAACMAALALGSPAGPAQGPGLAARGSPPCPEAAALAGQLRGACAAALGIGEHGGVGGSQLSNARSPAHEDRNAGPGQTLKPDSGLLAGGWAAQGPGGLQLGRTGALREVALLLFSPELRRALGAAPAASLGSAGAGREAAAQRRPDGGDLAEEEVAAALAHGDYKVRAATLKALRRSFSGAHPSYELRHLKSVYGSIVL